MLVVYVNKKNDETLICDKRSEGRVKKEWFGPNNSRNIRNYSRREAKRLVQIVSK